MTRFLTAVLGAAMSLGAAAGDFVPGGNAGALARPFALPALGEAPVLARGQAESRVTLDIANEYVHEGYTSAGACAAECILLDGETTRLRFTQRRGLGGGWDLSLDVPVLHTGGGFLDGWIEQWHGWFGLPNGGRNQAARGQYHYRYERAGAAPLDVTEGGTCLGDVSVGLGRALSAGTALRAQYKAPTGNDHPLCGGNAGGALWLDAALPLPGAWRGYVAAGYSYNERGDVLPALQKRDAWFGGLGLLAPVTDGARLHLQLYGHTRLYDGSELSPLARAGAPLTIGLQLGRRPERAAFELGFQEDPSVNASPDFAAYLSVSARGR